MKKIAICSAKGGVGKTTITILLARLLQENNYRVGILDADIYGPNILQVTDFNKRNTRIKKNDTQLTPFNFNGLKISSIELLINSKNPRIWRGPLLARSVKYLLNNTDWGRLDYLLIDMPPGTGDAYLSIFKDTDVDNALVVTKADIFSIQDTKKTLELLKELKIRILGIAENMSESFVIGQPGVPSKEIKHIFSEHKICFSLPNLAQKQIFKSFEANTEVYNYIDLDQLI